jgi:hypothetical protein
MFLGRVLENSHPLIRMHRIVGDIGALVHDEPEIHEVAVPPDRPGTITRTLLMTISAFALDNADARSCFSMRPPPARWPVGCGDTPLRPHLVVNATLGRLSQQIYESCMDEIRQHVRIGVIQLDERGLFEAEDGFGQMLALGFDVDEFTVTSSAVQQ